MAAGDFAKGIMRATAGIVSELDPKKTLKLAPELTKGKAYKAGAKTANFLGGGIRDTVTNMSKSGGKMKFDKAIKAAHSSKITDPKLAKALGKNVGDFRVDAKKVAGTAIGVSMAGRVVTGGGLYKDKNGNTNIPGIPFI